MNKLNLFIILILSIVFSLGFRVIEGVCNYDIKSASKEQKKTLCAATNIHKNNLSMADYKKNLGGLSKLITKTSTLIMKNKKDAILNRRNNAAMKNAVSSEDDQQDESGGPDPCEDYPQYC